MSENEIVKILAEQNEEFKKLGEEHRQLDQLIAEFTGKVYLTPEDEIEKQRLKKLKLQKKDKMAELIRKYRAEHSN